MELKSNSLWTINSDLDGVESGIYRVLDVWHEVALVLLFPLKSSRSFLKPITLNVEEFVTEIDKERVVVAEFNM